MKYFLAAFLGFAFFCCKAQQLEFNQIGFKLSKTDNLQIAKLANYEVRIFNGLFHEINNNEAELKINLYGKYKDFKAILTEREMKGLTESGFYSPSTNEIFVYYQGISKTEVVLHEISHALLHRNLSNPPRWFNEGLAEVLESLEEKDHNLQLYTQTDRLDKIKEQNRSNPIAISSFINDFSSNNWLNKKMLDDQYNLSYSIIYYIIKSNPQKIGEMVLMMQKRNSIDQIFTKCFGSLNAFQKAYQFYYR